MSSRHGLLALFLAGLIATMPAGPDPHAGQAEPATTRIDLAGDPLPPGAVARLGTVRFRHGGPVSALAVSVDGKLLASSGYVAMRLWDAATGRPLHRLPHDPAPRGFDFSPDGKTLALGLDQGAIVLWDPVAGRELRRWHGHRDGVTRVRFAPNGTRLASTGNDGAVCLWDAATGKELQRMTGHRAPALPRRYQTLPSVTALAFAPDGKTLASGGVDSTVRLWDAATGKELRQIRGHALTVPQVMASWNHPVLSISALAFAPDSTSLASACGNDRNAYVWDTATGKELRRLEGHGHGARSIVFSPDGQMLATGGGFGDGLIRLWDPATGKQRGQFPGHPDGVSGLVFLKGSANLVSASGGWSCAIRRWDVASGTDVSPGGGHQNVVAALAFTPDGKTLASASWDRTVRLWEPATGWELRRLDGHAGEVNAVAFAPDGKVLASGSVDRYDPGAVRLWEAATGKPLRRLPHDHGARRVLFAPDGRTLVVCDNRSTIHVWDATAGIKLRSFPREGATLAALSPDGKYLATESESGRSIVVRDLAKGREFCRLTGSAPAPLEASGLAFSPDGKTLAAADWRHHLHLWEVATGRKRWAATSNDVLYTVAFSPDGRLAAAGSRDCTVPLWDYFTGKEIQRFKGHHGTVDTIAFDPRGRTLASAGSDTTILIWKVSEVARKAPPDLAPGELPARWADLASTDAARAFQAIGRLAAAPGPVVSWFEKQLASAPVNTRLTALVGDLESRQFTVRVKASLELARLGAAAEPALRRALTQQPALETRRRVQQLLDQLDGPITHPEVLRELRVVEVLEHRGTAEARALLATLAAGIPGAWRSQAAEAALHRLNQRAAAGP